MGGVTIAHQPVNTTEDDYYPDAESVVDHPHYSQLLAAAAAAAAVSSNEPWDETMPSVEDLTGEVQDLMMSINDLKRESMNHWLQPWMTDNVNCLAELDQHMYAQSVQLEDLFGQDEMALSPNMMNQALYDEISFVPKDISLTLSAPTSSTSSPNTSTQASPVASPRPSEPPLVVAAPAIEENRIEESTMAPALKRRRSASSSDDSSDSSEEEEDSEGEDVLIPTTVATMNSRRQRMSFSDSDSDSEANPSTLSPMDAYMHKRQIEETLLNRITHHLNPEKLPGILSILASEKAEPQEDEEVEIDLSCLAREQLVQILCYVDACILEQNGGPAVNLDHFVKGKKHRPERHTLRRKPCPPRTQSRAELTETLDSSCSESEALHPLSVDRVVHLDGPISMASLTKKHKTARPAPKRRPGQSNKPKHHHRRRRRRPSHDLAIAQPPDCIASTRPKRRAAVHKRRLLEQMLAPSDNESEDDAEDGMLVVYSDEKMDFNVLDNQTIAHSSSPILSTPEQASITLETEETDEEIDIMC
ncbi:hypothetical protein BY458DRAFT_493564 [Sporodiniella umbellata]|nr:hypothetical protein BY458DRAFT_493564 [Sporodiniella umbellata]